MDEWMVMKHPDTKGTALVAISSFKATHSRNGWEPISAGNSTKEELADAAALLGKNVSGEESVAELEELVGVSEPKSHKRSTTSKETSS